MELKELVEQTKKTFADFQTALTAQETELKETGRVSTETKSLLDRLSAKFDELEAKMVRMSRIIVPAEKDVTVTVAPVMSAFEKHLRYGREAVSHFSAEEKAAWNELQTKGLTSGDDSKVGILSPEDFQQTIIKKLPNFANVGGIVGRQTTSKDVVRWPSLPYATDDISTHAMVVTWEDETDSATETEFTMGSVAVPVKKARALIKVANELLEDASIDVVGLLTSLIAEAFGIEEDKVFTSGAGGKKPEGFMTNADIASVNSGSGTDFTFDGIINLTYTLPEQYANGASYMCKRASVGNLRKLKDSQGQPLWQPSLALGQPATFNGYQLRTNEHMPAVAGSAKPLIFADFKRLYLAVERMGLTVKRLDEKYADTDEVGFIVRRRFGGKVIAPWAAKKQNISA